VKISSLGELSVSLLLVSAVTGCSLDVPAAPAESSAASALLPEGMLLCNPFICGDNAATAGDGLLFDEFDLGRHPNYAHVQMIGAEMWTSDNGPGIPVTLHIDHDVMYATTQNQIFIGDTLVGLVIEMKYQNGAAWDRFQLRIFEYDGHSIRFFAGEDEPIPTYLIKSRRLDREGGLFSETMVNPPFKRFACNNDVPPIDPTWSAAPHNAMAFRGDRYHPTDKRVYDLTENDPSSDWSFLACAGGAAAKLHLYRHTYAGGFRRATGSPDYMTTIDQRTMLMKTITADYCGHGSPTFTKTGTPLRFDVNASFGMPPVELELGPSSGAVSLRSYEAVWDEYGAVCLDEPRRYPPRDDGTVWTHHDVELACGHPIQTCTSMIPSVPSGWRAHGYTVTANPCRDLTCL
jgi:ADYC domain